MNSLPRSRMWALITIFSLNPTIRTFAKDALMALSEYTFLHSSGLNAVLRGAGKSWIICFHLFARSLLGVLSK